MSSSLLSLSGRGEGRFADDWPVQLKDASTALGVELANCKCSVELFFQGLCAIAMNGFGVRFASFWS